MDIYDPSFQEFVTYQLTVGQAEMYWHMFKEHNQELRVITEPRFVFTPIFNLTSGPSPKQMLDPAITEDEIKTFKLSLKDLKSLHDE